LIEYLSHEDFYYFIRVQNNLSEPQTVVARIFLAPEDEIDDRRTWIELDRFSYGLKPQERAVLFRPSDQSSVVRKPALKPDDLTADDGASPAREAQPWCDCGWAYTALLPRGTKKGMRFRLLVMLSNGSDLIMPDPPECCTAISYCGLQDLKYPDKAPMGFPFDRDFRDSLTETVNKYDNWAWRTISIRCKNL
jgi:tyrosinase